MSIKFSNALSMGLLAILCIAADPTTNPSTMPTVIKDGAATFSMEAENEWRVLGFRSERQSGLLFMLRKYRTDITPSESFSIQEESGERAIDKEVTKVVKPAEGNNPLSKPKIEKDVVDGEEARRVEFITDENELRVDKVVYITNHAGRFYYFEWTYVCEPTPPADLDKNLKVLLKSFKWTDKK